MMLNTGLGGFSLATVVSPSIQNMHSDMYVTLLLFFFIIVKLYKSIFRQLCENMEEKHSY